MDAELRNVFNSCLERDYLSSQCREYESISTENQQLEEHIKQLEHENNELTQRLLTDTLEEKYQENENLYVAEQKLARKNVDNDSNWKIYRSVTGYSLTYEPWNEQEGVKQTWYYNEKCYVCIAIASSGHKDLIEIAPNHPNFLELRKFLMVNQDVKGLLASLYKYFKFIEEREGSSFIETTN